MDEERTNLRTPSASAVELSEVLQCTDAPIYEADGGVAHYTANSRLMPFADIATPANSTAAPSGGPAKPARMSTVRDSSDSAMIWDGPIVQDWKGGSASATV